MARADEADGADPADGANGADGNVPLDGYPSRRGMLTALSAANVPHETSAGTSGALAPWEGTKIPRQ